MCGTLFPKLAGAKKTDTVMFSYVVYATRAQRDKVNAKVMKDPRLASFDPKKMPFDMTKMSFGGFKVEIDADPIFTDIRVYVHPYGVVPLGEIVVKKRWKIGVGVAPMLYASARDDFFFNRYKETWKALWPQGRAPGRRPRPPCARACGRA